MAYVIFNNNNDLVQIAANDADKDSLNINLSDHSVQSISDSDFSEIRLNKTTAIFDGSTVTNQLLSYPEYTEATFKQAIESSIYRASCFVNVPSNQSNPMYTGIRQFLNDLEVLNLSTSSLTYPINKTLEEYCNENGITFYHPLQIP
mgnify:FL=1